MLNSSKEVAFFSPIITITNNYKNKYFCRGKVMKGLFTTLFIVVGITFSGVSFAVTTTVIDFEELADGPIEAPIISKGFILDPAVSGVNPVIDSTFFPGKKMIFCGWCTDGVEGISIYSQAGVSFELDSLDAESNGEQLFTGQVIGYLEGGGTISQAISTIGTINFDQTWVNLTSIDVLFNLTSGPASFVVPALDNITLQAVPVPAAAWLFGSALAGLGWLRRKQTI